MAYLLASTRRYCIIRVSVPPPQLLLVALKTTPASPHFSLHIKSNITTTLPCPPPPSHIPFRVVSASWPPRNTSHFDLAHPVLGTAAAALVLRCRQLAPCSALAPPIYRPAGPSVAHSPRGEGPWAPFAPLSTYCLVAVLPRLPSRLTTAAPVCRCESRRVARPVRLLVVELFSLNPR